MTNFIDILGYTPKHLSHSTVDGYRFCGKKHFLGKVLQLEQRPGLAGMAGNTMHAVADRIDEYILEFGYEDEASLPSTESDIRSEAPPVATRDETGF